MRGEHLDLIVLTRSVLSTCLILVKTSSTVHFKYSYSRVSFAYSNQSQTPATDGRERGWNGEQAPIDGEREDCGPMLTKPALLSVSACVVVVRVPSIKLAKQSKNRRVHSCLLQLYHAQTSPDLRTSLTNLTCFVWKRRPAAHSTQQPTHTFNHGPSRGAPYRRDRKTDPWCRCALARAGMQVHAKK